MFSEYIFLSIFYFLTNSFPQLDREGMIRVLILLLDIHIPCSPDNDS